MEETISTTREMEIRQNDTPPDWFDTFERCYGITEGETDRLKPLNDIQTDKYTQQGQAVCGIFCNEVTKAWHKRVFERGNLYKQFRTEGLGTEEDAYEVISSCQYVLNKVYEIHTQKAVGVKLKYKCGKGKLCVEIAGVKVATAQKSLLKKFSRQSEPHWGISILYGSPRILLMAEFLKKCFLEELGRRTKKRKADQNGGNSGKQEKTRIRENKVENDDYGEKESQNWPLTSWLVSNCLYTLGELVYAEQYIAINQESYSGDIFKELCNELGIPWAVMGRPIQEILHVLEDKNGVGEDIE